MIKVLKVKNGFYDKEVKVIEFERGLNILASKNGSGKSHTLECINYSLFGNSCLRSSIKDYKEGFLVELEFYIKDELYKVRRSDGTAKLFKHSYEDEWELIVNGITAVNTHIRELLAYDYKVYSLTNYCAQDSLLSLTSSTSTSLASLVESISGADKSVNLEKYFRDKLTQLRADKKALLSAKENSGLEDLNFTIKEDYEALTKDKESLKAKKDLIVKYRDNVEISKSFLRTSKEVFKNYSQSQIQLENLRDYEGLDLSVLTEALKAIQEAQVKYDTLVKQFNSITIPEKEYTEEYLKEQEDLIELNQRYNQYLKIKAQIESHKLSCPNCKHEFYNTSLKVEDSFESVPGFPSLSSKEISLHRQWNSNKHNIENLREEIKGLKDFLDNNPSISEVDVQISNYNEYIKAKEALSKTKQTLEVFIKELKSFEVYSDFFKEGVEDNFEEDFKLYTDKYITVYEEIIRQSEEYLENYIKYIADKRAYTTILKTLEGLEEKLAKVNKEFELFTLLYELLKKAKKHVQTESLPVINSLASDLISTITNDERNSIEITKNFEILLDNTNVSVAEMSAQVIANVALRFSLLNTFYKDSMLLFIGDEIDSSLHEDRFNYLERCLNNLTDLGYQIILVSHKEFFSGNIIDLQKI